jgi:glutamate 5-kinase
MTTKFEVAKKLANQGIEVVIANGVIPDNLLSAVLENNVGTQFVPSKRVSSLKRRIAHSGLAVRGSAQINLGATESIMNKLEAHSLLLVGVESISGEFEKGDVIEIKSHTNRHIGYGISQYSSQEALAQIGEHNVKPLIHFDHMFVD